VADHRDRTARPPDLETGLAQIDDDAMGQAVTFLGYEWTDLT
jgi:hypothetical protein